VARREGVVREVLALEPVLERMCELFGWNSTEAARPERYLRAFRARGGATADHVDGWGLAWLSGGAFRLEKEPEPPENRPHHISVFPSAPDLSGVRRRSSGVPRLELIINRNVEDEGDRVAYGDRNRRGEHNLEFGGITPMAQHGQPKEGSGERERR